MEKNQQAKVHRITQAQRQSLVKLREETGGRGSDYLYGVIFKDPAKYGFEDGWVPSVGRIQNILREEGVLKKGHTKTYLREIGEKTVLKTPFGNLKISASRAGVTVSDGKHEFTFFKEE